MKIPRILYLTHRVPFPPNRGDRIRTYNILKFLACRAHVSLACLADEPLEPGARGELEQLCERVSIVPVEPYKKWLRAGSSFLRGRSLTERIFHSPVLQNEIRHWSRTIKFDTALASSSGLAGYLRMPELRGVDAHIDLIDVDSRKWLDYAAASTGPRAWMYRAEGRRLQRFEKELATWTRAVTVVSEAEAEIYRSFCPDGNVVSISNGVDIDYFRPIGQEQRQECVFVGALDYRPNVDGVCWFSREIWPEIRRRKPRAMLRLVGREPTKAVRELAELPGIDVLGSVPDVRPYLGRAAIAVVPLRIARGVQNKVLEALAMGKAVVASPQPLVGLDVQSGVHLMAAETKDEWADSIVELFDDPDFREELGLVGSAFVSAYHRWESCLQPLAQLLGLSPTPSELDTTVLV